MSSSEETAIDLLNRFFSPIGRIPETIQISLREAFQLKYRCQPKDNPSEFRTYLLAQANCDEELKIALESNEKPRRSVTSRTSIKDRGPSSHGMIHRRDSIPISDENEETVIYSQYEGIEPTLKAVNELRKRYKNHEFRSSNSLNPNLKCVSGSFNSTTAVIRIEYPKRLRSADDYILLSGDHEQLAEALARRCRRIARSLVESLGHRNLPLGNPYVTNVDTSIFVGRFMREVDEVKDPTKMKFIAILEPLVPPDLGIGQDPIQLILSTLKNYNLFPGQTIAVIGTSRVDQFGQGRIHPIEIIPGLTIPPPLVESSTLKSFNEASVPSGIHMVMVSGPYCSPLSLDTFLLDHFIKQVESDVPHILVLLGPFVDINNKIVASDAIVVQTPGSTDQRYLSHADLYQLMLRRIVNSISLKQTIILIVPSIDDVGHPFPIPQPPLDLKRLLGNLPHKNVRSCSNPCNISLSNTFKLSITSSDPITPILKTLDSTLPPGKPRVEKAHSLLLMQRTFFPAHPHPDPIDASMFDKVPCIWEDDQLPDIVLYSSHIAPGVQIYDDRAFINIGRLASDHRPCYCQAWIHSGNLDQDSSMLNLCLSDKLRVDVMDFAKVQLNC